MPQLYHREKPTMAGIWIRQTCRAYAEPISSDKTMFPFSAKEMAFINSVIFGTYKRGEGLVCPYGKKGELIMKEMSVVCIPMQIGSNPKTFRQ